MTRSNDNEKLWLGDEAIVAKLPILGDEAIVLVTIGRWDLSTDGITNRLMHTVVGLFFTCANVGPPN